MDVSGAAENDSRRRCAFVRLAGEKHTADEAAPPRHGKVRRRCDCGVGGHPTGLGDAVGNVGDDGAAALSLQEGATSSTPSKSAGDACTVEKRDAVAGVPGVAAIRRSGDVNTSARRAGNMGGCTVVPHRDIKRLMRGEVSAASEGAVCGRHGTGVADGAAATA